MRVWYVVIALGLVAEAAGAFLYISHSHRTVGLAGAGLGILLVIIGVAGTLSGRGKATAEVKKPVAPPRQTGGLRKALIAIAIVAIIGAGTFYGVSYVSNNAPGGISVSSGSNTASGGTSITTSQTGSSQTSANSSSNIGSGSTGSESSSGSGQQATGSNNSGSTVSSLSSSTGYPFVLDGSPNIKTPNSLNATMTFVYTNHGSTSLLVNLFVTIDFPNGTNYNSGLLFNPNTHTVGPGQNFSGTAVFGPLPAAGSYDVSFYVTTGTYGPDFPMVSSQTTVSITVAE